MKNTEMSRFFPLVPKIPQQELRNRNKFIVNFSHGAKYQKSAIIHCQKQLNEFSHQQTRRKKEEEEEQEERWREWMAGLEERMRRRREGLGGREGEA